MAKWPNSCTVIVMPSTTIKARSVINNAIFLLRPTYDALKNGMAQYSVALPDILGLSSGYKSRFTYPLDSARRAVWL